MIQAEHLTRRYGRLTAVDDISFHIHKGEVIGFLGPNGAGKSTTMNMLTGCISATEGRALIGGIDILEDPTAAKRLIGYLPEQPPLYLDMTVVEYLRTVCDLKGITKRLKRDELDRVMQKVGVTNVSGRLVKNLSKGYRQRVGLAQAMIGSPPILILDEPTVGLDPGQIIGIRNLITDLGKEHTVILSSHILPEVQAVCERVMIINQGRIVASDTPENLSRRLFGLTWLQPGAVGSSEQVKAIMGGIRKVKSHQVEPGEEEGTVRVECQAGDEDDIRQDVFLAFSDAKVPLLLMRPIDLSLEEVFLGLTDTAEVKA